MKRPGNVTKQQKRQIRRRTIYARLVDFAMHQFARVKTPPETEQFQQDLSKMTNWQNSQWLRAGADREDTARFLEMDRSETIRLRKFA